MSPVFFRTSHSCAILGRWVIYVVIACIPQLFSRFIRGFFVFRRRICDTIKVFDPVIEIHFKNSL